MTMKIISRTRTTSTNDVTLISDLTPPAPPTCMSISLNRALPLTDRLSDQADVLKPRCAAGPHYSEDVAVLDPLVALDCDLTVGRPLMNFLEQSLELLLADDVGAEVDGPVFLDG